MSSEEKESLFKPDVSIHQIDLWNTMNKLIIVVELSRIIEVEKKVDSIYSLLQSGPSLPSGLPLQTPGIPTPLSLASQEDADIETSPHQRSISDTPNKDDSSQYPGESVDVIQMGLISVEEAESLLHTVIVQYAGFPWVRFPSELPLESFRKERPFLLLSLLALASQKQGRLYDPLQSEFKRILGASIIMDGAPDLDLLQGLLVFLAWYHLHPRVQPQKMYMFAQIAVAICADIHIPKLIANESNTELKAELERTYLGVYYMSSCESMVFRKPISMMYDDYAGKCGQSLADSSILPIDAELRHFVGLRRLAEEIASTFRYDTIYKQNQLLRLETVELSVKAFKCRLHELRGWFPPASPCLPSLMLAYESTNIYLHEVVLHMELPVTTNPVSLNQVADNSSHRHRTLLLSCLEATKSFIDCFLQIPPALCARHSTQERGYLAHALMVLIRLAFNTNLDSDSPSLREACNVSYYIDAVSEHAAASSATTLDDGHPETFPAFKAMAERLKSWYERTELLEQVGTPSDLKDMSPLQFVKIAKEEQLIDFDFGNMDFSFLEAPNFWG